MDEWLKFYDGLYLKIGKFPQNYYLRTYFILRIMSFITKIHSAWIIQIFAILHALVALFCRFVSIDDELLLTMLTMVMTLLICNKQRLNIEFTAAGIIAVNVIGYLLGNGGARFLQHFFTSDLAIHALATFFTTQILGFSILAITQLFPHQTKSSTSSRYSQVKWLYIAIAAIFILRLGLLLLFTSEPFVKGDIENASSIILSSSGSFIIIASLVLLYIRFSSRRNFTSSQRIIYLSLFIITISLLETFIVGYGFTSEFNENFISEFPILLLVSFLSVITIYCVVYMVYYALDSRGQMQKERGRANLASYQYMKLKQQLNPHFLFNSLNALDSLICENKNEQASLYTHKLASLYRYMLKSEDEKLVSLKEELDFVSLYVDLMKVRFPEGFQLNVDVPEHLESRNVIPCSIQLLVENAIKHNSINVANQLKINVIANDDFIEVSNNIIKKFTKSTSIGVGQKYIRQQYFDLSGKNIEIIATDDNYIVKLPLI